MLGLRNDIFLDSDYMEDGGCGLQDRAKSQNCEEIVGSGQETMAEGSPPGTKFKALHIPENDVYNCGV